jgi:hypothetical protein
MKKQFFMLLVIVVACGALAIRMGWFGFPLFWLGANFLILAGAYLTRAHRVFGKTPTGTLPLWSWCAFFPYLIYASVVWNLARILSREQSTNQVTDNLVVGRRLLTKELVGDCANYVDLTTEFQEPCEIRRSSAYISFPILDAGAPKPESLRKAVASLKPGKTFVHCAQGHGRTGLFALAILITTRVGTSVEDGLKLLQDARPGIRLNKEQLRCIEHYARLIAE